MNTRSLITITTLTAALSFSTAALAGDNDPSTSNITSPNIIVPYDGYLALDNTPMNGQLNLRFELYDAPTAGNLLWTEDQASLNFYNGRFSVGLGSVTPVTNVVLDAEKVYLGIKIDDGTGTYVALSGRQAIQPAPYSAWSANASDFKVAGNLDVEGTTTLKGPLRFDMDEDWTFQQTGSGTNAGIRLTNQDGANSNMYVRTGGQFVVQATDGTWRLSVDGANGNTTMRGNGFVTNDLNVTRDTSVGRNLSVAGNLTVDGDITNFSVSGEYNADRLGVGQIETTLASRGNSMCYLTKVRIGDTDAEDAECFITSDTNNWILRAQVYASDARVRCTARCLTW